LDINNVTALTPTVQHWTSLRIFTISDNSLTGTVATTQCFSYIICIHYFRPANVSPTSFFSPTEVSLCLYPSLTHVNFFLQQQLLRSLLLLGRHACGSFQLEQHHGGKPEEQQDHRRRLSACSVVATREIVLGIQLAHYHSLRDWGMCASERA
jgi:hypothetical protein